MSIWDDIEGIGEDVIDTAGDIIDEVVNVAESLFEGPGVLTGIVTAGAALFVMGPGAIIPAFISGSVAGNALIRHRYMTSEERAFAESVFGSSLPPNDRIVLTNLEGLEGRKFVCPNINGEILVNLGNAYDNPVSYSDSSYPALGKVFIHELTHVWQIYHTSFVPGLVCNRIYDEISGGLQYEPGSGGKDWSQYNLEQQATIVDEWFAPSSRGPMGSPRSSKHPFYLYIEKIIRSSFDLIQANNFVVFGAIAEKWRNYDVF